MVKVDLSCHFQFFCSTFCHVNKTWSLLLINHLKWDKNAFLKSSLRIQFGRIKAQMPSLIVILWIFLDFMTDDKNVIIKITWSVIFVICYLPKRHSSGRSFREILTLPLAWFCRSVLKSLKIRPENQKSLFRFMYERDPHYFITKDII